jgi:phosphatidylglycerophosphate synthase
LTGFEATARAHERAPLRPVEERKRHPREMEDWLNFHIYHPLANRLADLLAATPATPNMVSFAGWMLIVAAAFLYTGLSWPVSVLAAWPLHLLWHVFDGADGALARRTGKSSPLGELVDGVCDYTGHIVLYVALAAFLDDWIGGWAWLAAAFSGLSRILQSNHSETQRRTYLWRVYGVPWLKNAFAASEGRLHRRTLFTTIFEPLGRLYVAIAAVSSPLSERIDAMVAKADSPSDRDRIARVCKVAARRPLRAQTVLGPNIRTVVLGLSMAAGSPLWFFLFEILPLNLLLLWSKRLQRRADLSVVAHLDA